MPAGRALRERRLPNFFRCTALHPPRCYHAGMATPRVCSIASALLVLFAYGTVAPNAYAEQKDLDQDFKAAVGLYEAGEYPEAAAQLEKLVREVPESFEVQELLGLVYSAQSENARATQHFQKAVTLKPDSAPARTNLA